MSLSITKELESSLRLAFAEAKARRHEHVTLEHLLYALLRDPVATRILRACGARLQELKRELEQHLLESQPQLPDGFDRDPEQTRAFQRVLERAAMQVQSSGKETIDAGSVLVALFRASPAWTCSGSSPTGRSRSATTVACARMSEMTTSCTRSRKGTTRTAAWPTTRSPPTAST